MKSCFSDLFKKDGSIARHMSGYEIRPQQVRMVEAVEDAISSSQNLIVEAGTGVGKSLAYLVPFISWAVREKKKVVISTYTKALQNQLFVKDLPFLERVMDIDFLYSVCMGSENYLCSRKAYKNSFPDFFSSKNQKAQVGRIMKWMRRTETGLVTDMDFVPAKAVWSKFSRESDMCRGQKCRYKGECFYRKDRQKQAESHLLITNHSLLFTDLVSEARVLPDFHALVLDEAHTLEDVATNHFGVEISSSGLRFLLDNISRFEDVSGKVRELRTVSDMFFEKAGTILGKADRVTHIDRDEYFSEDTILSLADLSAALSDLSDVLEDPEEAEIAKAYSIRCDMFSNSLEFLFGSPKEQYVYWAEIKKWKSGTNYSFHAAPIDISNQMRMYLFERYCPCVLTSATLSLSGRNADFSFVLDRLGLEDPMELALDSPFDYENMVLSYIPSRIADPNREFTRYKRDVYDNIVKIYDIMGGRIFALFTSYDMLDQTAESISKERSDINILRQGDLPRYVLLDVFKKSGDTILMGTTTFWQGVDVPGSSLECVIITKLPFSVPSDPVNAARIRSIHNKGRNPFNEYQVPRAVIMFKQGFGRLIRSNSDRGVVAVLDPRIRTRYYGREFLKAMPKCHKTNSLNDIKAFFQK